ncbi:MAG: Rv3235 family protein, partial [Micromonosporaceae bacterium]
TNRRTANRAGGTPGGRPPSTAPASGGAGVVVLLPVPRLAVLRVQVGEPRIGAAEVAVVLTRRERVWAMALRLEVRAGRWVCTHLQVL